VVNSAIAGAGCFTGGSSLMGLKTTRNPAAKAFYCLSVVSSSTAITTAGFVVLARTCQISETAALSEACATPFMVLGNQANVRALLCDSLHTLFNQVQNSPKVQTILFKHKEKIYEF